MGKQEREQKKSYKRIPGEEMNEEKKYRKKKKKKENKKYKNKPTSVLSRKPDTNSKVV